MRRMRMVALYLAEAVRFELTDGFPSPVFKTGAIDHSATLPLGLQRAILPARLRYKFQIQFLGT